MSRGDVKTTVVTTAFCGVLVGAVLVAIAGPWLVACCLGGLVLWLVWGEARRERA